MACSHTSDVAGHPGAFGHQVLSKPKQTHVRGESTIFTLPTEPAVHAGMIAVFRLSEQQYP